MTQEAALFTEEELLNHAKGNVTAFILGSIALLKKDNRSVADWARSIGALFAPGWEEPRGKGALAAARIFALNAASAGATIESLTGDERQAQGVTAGWPSQEMLDFVGLNSADVDPFWTVFQPIADFLDLAYQWRVEGDRFTFTLAQR
jgi:hypothetical protein